MRYKKVLPLLLLTVLLASCGPTGGSSSLSSSEQASSEQSSEHISSEESSEEISSEESSEEVSSEEISSEESSEEQSSEEVSSEESSEEESSEENSSEESSSEEPQYSFLEFYATADLFRSTFEQMKNDKKVKELEYENTEITSYNDKIVNGHDVIANNQFHSTVTTTNNKDGTTTTKEVYNGIANASFYEVTFGEKASRMKLGSQADADRLNDVITPQDATKKHTNAVNKLGLGYLYSVGWNQAFSNSYEITRYLANDENNSVKMVGFKANISNYSTFTLNFTTEEDSINIISGDFEYNEYSKADWDTSNKEPYDGAEPTAIKTCEITNIVYGTLHSQSTPIVNVDPYFTTSLSEDFYLSNSYYNSQGNPVYSKDNQLYAGESIEVWNMQKMIKDNGWTIPSTAVDTEKIFILESSNPNAVSTNGYTWFAKTAGEKATLTIGNSFFTQKVEVEVIEIPSEEDVTLPIITNVIKSTHESDVYTPGSLTEGTAQSLTLNASESGEIHILKIETENMGPFDPAFCNISGVYVKVWDNENNTWKNDATIGFGTIIANQTQYCETYGANGIYVSFTIYSSVSSNAQLVVEDMSETQLFYSNLVINIG